MTTMTHNRWRPLTAGRPYEVAEALRDRAVKIDDDTTAGYLMLAAETIERHVKDDRPTRTRKK